MFFQLLFDLGAVIAFNLAVGAAIMCFLTAAELIWPKGPVMVLRDRAITIGLTAFSVVSAIVAATVIGVAIPLPQPLIPKPTWYEGILAALLADLLYYWFHRAEHSIPWLWRIHSVHHAQPLGAGAGYHHLLEGPLRVVLVTIPFTLLFGGEGGIISFFVVTLHVYYIHSTTRLNFGPIAWLFCDNRVHRIHHSTDPAHFDRNFGVVTLLWDHIFGTAYWPKAEWPGVGVAGMSAPKRMGDLVTLPPRVEGLAATVL